MKVFSTRLLTAAFLATAAIATPFAMAPQAAAQAAEVRQVVNGVPITSVDVQRRTAFLRLQQRGGGQNAALNEMVEQVLRAQEMSRLNVRITTQQVDEAYARFASSNNMSANQMDSILSQSGVTRDHFKEYIRVQMGWGQALQARATAERGGVDQSALQELAKRGGTKPTATEYVLQQFIFVVPERERRSIMGRRKSEANAMRQRVSGCENTRELAKTVLDVSVRDLGRILEPELPPDWEKQVKAASVGNATAVRETPRGVEFLIVCSTRETNDDRVAEIMFQKERLEGQEGDQTAALDKKYTQELRERARITAR